MKTIKTMSSIEDVILISAELKDMAFESPKDLSTMQHLDRLGFELLAQLLNSRKVTQKEYWAAYLGWFDIWNHDLPCWGNDADCDFEWEDELYEKYNPTNPKLTLDDIF
jgi:hypothetical protein